MNVVASQWMTEPFIFPWAPWTLYRESDTTKHKVKKETSREALATGPLFPAIFKEFLHAGTKAEISIPFYLFSSFFKVYTSL